jgi:hypothetical protein
VNGLNIFRLDSPVEIVAGGIVPLRKGLSSGGGIVPLRKGLSSGGGIVPLRKGLSPCGGITLRRQDNGSGLSIELSIELNHEQRSYTDGLFEAID